MGFGFFNSPTPFKGQKYDELHKKAMESKQLFVDTEFPANDKSLSASGSATGIEWKRPKDIGADPKLFVDGASSNDLNQGELGNCWFVAACSCLALNKDIWKKVIPNHTDQEWDSEHPEKYAGIFHFQFWRFGEWLDVVVDDFLPTRGGQLIYIHSKTRNEFWSALLEKAYAKLFGNYEALDKGELAEGLEDFTGGVAEPVELATWTGEGKKKEELFKIMEDAFDDHALLAAAIPAKNKDEMEKPAELGLVMGHAYGITAVKHVPLAGTGIFKFFNREKLTMVRLRNPWGRSEWKGAFSDGSKEWNKISQSDRNKIGLTFDDDGEFWMTYDDFCHHFVTMSICRVVNTSFFSLKKAWSEAVMHSEWVTPHRAGGCINNREKFLSNPHFVFDVSDKEDEILVALTQKSGRGEGEKFGIGFNILKVAENLNYRLHKIPEQMVTSSPFKQARSIFMRQTLKRGRYALVACTFNPDCRALFLLRLYTSSNSGARELSMDKPAMSPLATMCACIPMFRYPTNICQIKVLRGMGLEKQDKIGGADPYFIVSCERQKVTSFVCNDTLTPEWNVSAIFYRKQPSVKPILIQVWNSNPVRDEFMGECRIPAIGEMDGRVLECELFGRKGEANQKRPGKIFVVLTNSSNLQSI